MSDNPRTISLSAARRFLVHTFALDAWQTLPDVRTVIDRLEFVQEDSINMCGRIHDLVLWPRVLGYTPTDLHRALYESPRQAWEYYFPNLCALPLADISYFRRAMQAREAKPGRWHGLEGEEETVAASIFARLDEHGPIRTRSAGVEHGHTTSGWGTRQTVAGRVLEKLWLHGRLTVAKRENFERYFDRSERHLPELLASDPLPDPLDEATYLTRKRLRARRLFRVSKADKELLGASAFAPVHLPGDSKPWHVLAEDAEHLEQAESLPTGDAVFLLAPLDPLVYDRARNRAVWGFDYTWEVYTPQAKRKWGYYVLPILHGDRLVGRVDPKMNRATGTLHLVSLRLEPDVEPASVAAALAVRLRDYARLLGAERIEFSNVEPPALRPLLEKHL